MNCFGMYCRQNLFSSSVCENTIPPGNLSFIRYMRLRNAHDLPVRRLPMAISHDGARGGSSVHATMPMTEPTSSSTRTGGRDAELNPNQSGAEALDAVEAFDVVSGMGWATTMGTSQEEILHNPIKRASAQPLARTPSRVVGQRLICVGQLPDLLPGFVERCALDAQTLNVYVPRLTPLFQFRKPRLSVPQDARGY